jgi:hypothetical protein
MDKNILKQLTEWIRLLMEEAKKDSNLAVSRFQLPKDSESPFKIVGGWSGGFSEEYADLLYVSKSKPYYAMCIKVAVEDDSHVYSCKDFDSLSMPTYKHGEVDDTCVPLELNDDPEQAAQFFLHEYERITKEYKAGCYTLE